MGVQWKPTAKVETLRERAKLIKKIREFFYERNVLEVDTPTLCSASVTDPHIESFITNYVSHGETKDFFLQTSPESALKRLLAAGIGDVYQIAHAYRNSEFGQKHNPEFTMLEWYRVDKDYMYLLEEVDVFLQYILKTETATIISYKELFRQILDINPLKSTFYQLEELVIEKNILKKEQLIGFNKKDLLDIIFSHLIEPKIGLDKPIAVYDFPEELSAMSTIKTVDGDSKVAMRFEFYYKGYELANGYNELRDADEQLERFKLDIEQRKDNNLLIPKIDYKLISALEHGLPKCTGVAIGLDRIVMLALNCKNIKDVIAFPIDIA